MPTSSLPRRAALSLAILVGVVGACGGPTATVQPSPSVEPASAVPTTAASPQVTAEPSSTPLPTATSSPTIAPVANQDYPELAWVNRFVMKVAVSDLNVRQKPSRTAKSNGKAPKGGLFMVFDWPIKADGYTWYYGFTLLTTKPGVLPELPSPIETGYDEVLGGWMATGTEDTPFLVPVAPRCPTTPDLASVAAMLDSERITCLGSEALTLEGLYRGEGCGGAAQGTFEPEWLASPLECPNVQASADGAVPLYLHFAPDGSALPPDGARIRVRGHFSDERASTCRITELGADESLSVPIANDAAAQWCRGKFVVDNVEVIG